MQEEVVLYLITAGFWNCFKLAPTTGLYCGYFIRTVCVKQCAAVMSLRMKERVGASASVCLGLFAPCCAYFMLLVATQTMKWFSFLWSLDIQQFVQFVRIVSFFVVEKLFYATRPLSLSLMYWVCKKMTKWMNYVDNLLGRDMDICNGATWMIPKPLDHVILPIET